MEISVISYGHPLWDKTISFAENCSWRAGPYLARKMRNNDFEKIERVIVATENNMPIGFCTFILKEDELPEDTKQSPFVGFVFVDEKSSGETVATSKSSHCFVDKGGKLIILKRSFPELDKKLKAIADNN